jgi:hypothetical protein
VPGLPSTAEPGRGQLTRSHARLHESAVGPQTQPAPAPPTGQHSRNTPDREVRSTHADSRLDTAYSQLAIETVVTADGPH